MRNDPTSLVIALIVILICCACDSVTTKDPLPVNPEGLQEDRYKFEGDWLLSPQIDDKDDDAVISVRFSDDGKARWAVLVWQRNKFHLSEGELIVAQGQSKQRKFICIQFQGEDGLPTFGHCFFWQYRFANGGNLIIWPPNAGLFRKAVQDGRLKGTVKQENFSTEITITSSGDDLLAFLDDPVNLQLFDYTEPVVLRRLWTPRKAEPSSAPDAKP